MRTPVRHPSLQPRGVVRIVEDVLSDPVDLVLRRPQVLDQPLDLRGSTTCGGDEGNVRREQAEGEGKDAEDVGSGGKGAVGARGEARGGRVHAIGCLEDSHP